MTQGVNTGDETQQMSIRAARATDRSAVLAFCERTWASGDYIPYVWDEWLADEDGELLVAALGERPVGLLHLRAQSADEVWIEGVRVDPAERRHGIGRALIQHALASAQRRGAQVARMLTDHDNDASQRLFGGFGFEKVAEMAQYSAQALVIEDAPSANVAAPTPTDGEQVEALSAQDLRLTHAHERDLERLWGWLEGSLLAPFNGGLELRGWAAQALTDEGLRQDLIAGDVWLLEGKEAIQALALTSAPPPRQGNAATLQARYVDGSAEGIGRLALALREVAGERGAERVEIWLPDLLILRDAMSGAGYTRSDDALWIYARPLR